MKKIWDLVLILMLMLERKRAYVFKTLNDADIVAASKLLATDANEDAIFKFILKINLKSSTTTKQEM